MPTLSDLYKREISYVLYNHEAAYQYQFLMGAIRSILQAMSISVFECCLANVDEVAESRLPQLAERFLRPSDGIMQQAISEGLALMRNHGGNLGDIWVSDRDGASLESRVKNWVAHRNSHVGHGVVTMEVISKGLEWLPALAMSLLDDLGPLFPDIDQHGECSVALRELESRLALPLLQLPEGKPITIRDITNRGDHWRVRYQTLSADDSTNGTYRADIHGHFLDLIQSDTRRYVGYRVPVCSGYWAPLVLLPSRQTPVFEGRTEQLKELRNWFDDTDSRVCNIYGEGGIGKTTLALEFLNSILDGRSDPPQWQPDVICFFTAKQTRWTANGLQVLHGIVPPVEDAVRELAKCIDWNLDASWYPDSIDSLVSKTADMLGDLGVSRNSILLILDNTETLASSAADEEEFGKLVGLISRRLGRVLVTSRRREQTEALPMRLPGLSVNEGVALLEKLGVEYEATPLQQSGRPAKRKISEEFNGRPLLLDVFAQLIGRFQYSLKSAREQVLRLAASDLGSFLYDDAWSRIESIERLALVALGQLGDTVSGRVVEYVSAELGVQHSALLDTYDKARFGGRLDYSTYYDLVIDPSARAFLARKFNGLSVEERGRVQQAASLAIRRQRDLIKAQNSVVSDRVIQAFRTDAAKAAKLAAARGDTAEAVFWYDQAITADPGNYALLDRFAFFLSSKVGEMDRAYALAREACAVDGADSDCYFTAGHVAASLGDIIQADNYLRKAQSIGAPTHRCSLQGARARVRAVQRALETHSWREAEKILSREEDQIQNLIDSSRIDSPRGSLDWKHTKEVSSVKTSLWRAREDIKKAKVGDLFYLSREGIRHN